MHAASYIAVAAAAAGSVAALSINTPASLVQCQPVQLTWTDGTGPFIIAAIPGGQVSAAAIETIADSQASSPLTWTVNLAAATNLTIKITDSTGTIGYSSPVVVQAGSSDSCLNATASTSGLTSASVSSTGSSSDTAAAVGATSASDSASASSSADSSSSSSSSSAADSSSSSSAESSSSSSAASSTAATSSAASTTAASSSAAGAATSATSAAASAATSAASSGAFTNAVVGLPALAAGLFAGVAAFL
ncbi:hypothetical protein IAR50_007036 [Cryptococcus sp. DSM 104548]